MKWEGMELSILKTIFHILVLTFYYYIGTWVQEATNLFIPGSIIGMNLLLITLLINGIKVSWIDKGASLLVNHLPLLFIPVTVGVIQYLDLLAGKGLLLILIVFISTGVVAFFSGITTQIMNRKKGEHYE
ncbi:CidA/LrgA family holin-like protein [Pontibacillus yanchengensis]|uniref:CidA/LrgA family holin-like protein n=1 Tax=Pontibacillus yanchengensis TaxID=462910 RepID=A0A6I4ZYV0_9BACI|nr:CidA/LrgA family holin-like protein [Pontibacillus yanchengensis]